MPVLLDRRVSHDHAHPAPERRATREQIASGETNPLRLEVGLVNNMPDSALQSTERQFLTLLRAAADAVPVRLRLFSLPDVPRGEQGRRHLSLGYRTVDQLWDAGLDALIVTGTEPRAASLMDEPYWDSFTRLLDWAKDNTLSTIWSCLAAHAAVLHLDGVRRRPLAEKCFGVFDCERTSDHPLLLGAAARLRVPHSRWNVLEEAPLTASNYSVLARSPDIGADTFVKQQRRSLFVFFQGHPEYDDGALLREYRRDIGRYLRHERDTYPPMPHGYFDNAAADELNGFRRLAESERREQTLDRFPTVAPRVTRQSAAESPAIQIYRNWLSNLALQKSDATKPNVCAPAMQSRRAAAPEQASGLNIEAILN